MLVVNQLSGFGSRRRVSGGGGGITLTAGNFSGAVFGYCAASNPFGLSAFGTISGQPVAGQTLSLFISQGGGSNTIAFMGDLTALIPGWTFTINGGSPLGFTAENFDGTYTTADVDTALDLFADGVAYTIVFTT